MLKHEELASRHRLTSEQAYRIIALTGDNDQLAETAACVMDSGAHFALVEYALLMGLEPSVGRNAETFAAAYAAFLVENSKQTAEHIGTSLKKLMELTVKKTAEIEEDWEFWREIIFTPSGILNLHQLKLELTDYRKLLRMVPKVYDHITGGRITKAFVDPSIVINAADEHYEEVLAEEDEDGGQEDEDAP